MKVALIGAELEENLGLRYMASSLEGDGHETEIFGFNQEGDVPEVVSGVAAFGPDITGLSMVFTGRARDFTRLARALREGADAGHIVAGGHFASFNYERLLRDFPQFDSVALGEGEGLLCALASNLDDLSKVPGLCYRRPDGSVAARPSEAPVDLDELPFPKRTEFHDYFGKPIASILSSRGCWRNCAFCSINAWYKRVGGRKFRVRSVENIVAEMADLYHRHGVRIYNFQDDNFFLPRPTEALRRFQDLREGLRRHGVGRIAIAVKARPDSITEESIAVLDDLGLFRVFLGVENASECGLENLNRRCSFDRILSALRILNDFDIHVAFNLLMFEPDTVMEHILTNLRFIERHMDNPFNFCRAEAYAGTGLESTLLSRGKLLGDYFGFDYRLEDPRSEAFHKIANYAFFDRNFSDNGLHYFNMQVDFYFQLLRRFHPEKLTQTLRSLARNFIKKTNLDTYGVLCRIYDHVEACEPHDELGIQAFAREMRQKVDSQSAVLHQEGEAILRAMDVAFEGGVQVAAPDRVEESSPLFSVGVTPYRGPSSLQDGGVAVVPAGLEFLQVSEDPVPYEVFRSRLDELRAEETSHLT